MWQSYLGRDCKNFFQDCTLLHFSWSLPHVSVYNNEKCNYCKRIRSGVYAACYFDYKNCNQEEVVSKLKIEFNTNECSFFAEIFETEKIENREQREQYMSDYVFSSS